MDTVFSVNPELDIPIYRQLVDQIRAAVRQRRLTAGQKLPTVQEVSCDLGIAVGTIKRAYDELERAGYLYTVPGKGSFVAAKNAELLREEHLKKIEEYMTAIADLARGAGVTRGEVLQMWDLIWEENE